MPAVALTGTCGFWAHLGWTAFRRPSLRKTQHAALDRERIWSDDTTHAIHESQTVRIQREHDGHPRDTAWTVAAYETPVSERMWHLTATGTTPAPMLQTLLTHRADGDGWDTALGSPITDKTVTAATRPLTDAGWTHTVDGQGNPVDESLRGRGSSVRRLRRPEPQQLPRYLAEELAHGTGTRKTNPHQAVWNTSRIKTSPQPAAPPRTPPISLQRRHQAAPAKGVAQGSELGISFVWPGSYVLSGCGWRRSRGCGCRSFRVC
ncbi:DUF317 domain-containing protein [Streptomyces sp. NPDC006872]|uniref:DUF317 domain-containing protein n=1 Tax=Streptomyces sp. NPDC006872 TaxID=3155720 RepID=UPI003400799C